LDVLQEQLVDPLSNVLNTHVLIYLLIGVGIYFTARTRFIQIRYFRLTGPLEGSGKGGLMKRAIMGLSAAAVIALAPLCIPPAQAHADNPCVSITDPAAHQACINEFLRNNPIHKDPGGCAASPLYGQLGHFCRDFWVRKSAPPGESATL
jgi:hypothetical protein